MPSMLRPANLFLVLTYLLLSAVPFAPLLLGKRIEQPAHILGIEFIAWITVWAACKRPAWFHWLLIPAFLALPTEIYLQAYYGQGISTHHLGIIAETSPKESVEFLGSKIWLMLAVTIGVILWWAFTLRIALRSRDFDWDDGSRWVAMAALMLGFAIWGYGQRFGVEPPPPSASAKQSSNAISSSVKPKDSLGASPASGFGDSDDEEDEDEDGPAASSTPNSAKAASSASSASAVARWPKLPSWAGIPFDVPQFSRSWPFGLTARVVDFWNERTYLAELSQKSKSFKFGAKQAQPNQKPEIVVMVIGESSRYDRWSLNGYERNTNPLLKQEANLIVLPDVITSVSATRLSVPVLISRKPAMQSLKDGFSEKSFLTAYKEAGFKTYWLSNQISFGQFDTPVSVFAKEADVVQFMNLGGFTDNSNFDQILFDPLKSAIADPAPKKLIVLHTLGSHWNYSHRYPKEFDKWQPSLFGVDKPAYTDKKIKPQLNNSYDSSILYTDWFLSQVIATLKSSNQLSSMLYIADHGQTLYDGSCNLAFHGHNTQFEFHVPAMMWYSDLYKQSYPAKVEQLLRTKTAKLATENVFHTLLDMGDIHYPTEHLEWSIFSPSFKTHKRYVDSYGWTNYDNATLKGDCREIIDKGKPLTQEK